MKRRTLVVTSILTLGIVAGGCTSQSSEATSKALTGLGSATTTTTTIAPGPTTTVPPCTHTNPLESLQPTAELPPPGSEMPAGSLMRDIQENKVLVAGVDENTPDLGARNPTTNKLEGLEVSLVKEIARAIFGDPEKVRFKTVVTAEKNQVVHDLKVDLTASADSMTCERWELVDFSTEYLTAYQKLLIRNDSGITSKDDLAGHTVCVTKGSSSVALLALIAPLAHSLEVDARNDCLVALQRGDADAYLGHDTFLRGMHAQDVENTTILPQELHTQNYGIALPKGHPEMVQFVNGVLEQMREDGRLQALYDFWLRGDAPAIPKPQYSS